MNPFYPPPFGMPDLNPYGYQKPEPNENEAVIGGEGEN
jgi:hypothetical protein